MTTKEEMTDSIEAYVTWSEDRTNPNNKHLFQKAYRKARRLAHLAKSAGCQELHWVFEHIYKQCEYYARYKEEPKGKDSFLQSRMPAAKAELKSANFKDYEPTPFN